VLSVVIPIHNEEPSLLVLYDLLTAVCWNSSLNPTKSSL
jgi:hypothetical protein